MPETIETQSERKSTEEPPKIVSDIAISYAGELVVTKVVEKPYDADKDPIGYGL